MKRYDLRDVGVRDWSVAVVWRCITTCNIHVWVHFYYTWMSSSSFTVQIIWNFDSEYHAMMQWGHGGEVPFITYVLDWYEWSVRTKPLTVRLIGCWWQSGGAGMKICPHLWRTELQFPSQSLYCVSQLTILWTKVYTAKVNITVIIFSHLDTKCFKFLLASSLEFCDMTSDIFRCIWKWTFTFGCNIGVRWSLQ